MPGNKNIICKRCHEDFSYHWPGGGVRQLCFTCNPPKKPKKPKKVGFNAYDLLDWGDLPYPWRPAKSTGNPTRWMGRHRLVVYTTNWRFSFGVQLMGNWHNRPSKIQVSEDNVPKALEWAVKCSQSIIDSFD